MSTKTFLAQILKTLFGAPMQEQSTTQPEFSNEQLADHEAAHGIVWYLFRVNWIVNSLSIERSRLPDSNMHGALHITANFDVKNQNNPQRENELVAIAYAGIIGQNINLILNDDMIAVKLFKTTNIHSVFNLRGCTGDFELARKNIEQLANYFGVTPHTFECCKISDLISLFYEHKYIQALHKKLSDLLLSKGTINREELTNFFEENRFADYIEEEALDTNFAHI